MKTILFLGIMLSVNCSAMLSNEPNLKWIAAYEIDDPGATPILAFTNDRNASVYVSAAMDLHGNGHDRIATSKYDKDGNRIWSADYPYTYPVIKHVYAITADSLGNLFITGNQYDNKESSKHGMFIVKYDIHGKELWAKQISDMSSSVLLVSDKHIYAGGGFFDKKNGYTLLKYNLEGKELFSHKSSPKRHYAAASTIFEKDDYIFIQGLAGSAKFTKEGTLVWAKEMGWVLDRNSPDRIFYVKRPQKNLFRIECKDEKETLLWETLFGDTHADDIDAPPLMVCDSQGNLYAGCTAHSMRDSSIQIVLAKYSQNGIKLWELRHKHTSASRCVLKGLTIDNFGAAYLLSYSTTNSEVSIFGDLDYFTMAKYTSEGTRCWSVRLQGNPQIMSIVDQDIYLVDEGTSLREYYRVFKYVQPLDIVEKNNEHPGTAAQIRASQENEQGGNDTTSELADLTEEEQAYVLRMRDYFDSILAKLGGSITKGDIVIPNTLYETKLYTKWGLDTKREFSIQELYYIMNLQQVDAHWKQYNSIDLSCLTEEEYAYLKTMHQKYGNEAINLRQVAMEQNRSLDQHQHLFFDLIKAVTGDDTLDDRGLVFSYHITPK